MIFMTEMKHISAVMLDQDVSNVTKELLRLGLFHFVQIGEIDDEMATKVETMAQDASSQRITEMRRRIESLLQLAGVSPQDRVKLSANDIVPIDTAASDTILDDINKRIEVLREQQKTLQTDILRLEDIKQQMDLFGGAASLVHKNPSFTFLFTRAGSIPDKNMDELVRLASEFPSVVLREREATGRTDIFLVAMKKDEARVQAILPPLGWQDLDISPEIDSVKVDIERDLVKKLSDLSESQASLAEASKKIIIEKLDVLLEMWKHARLNELYNRVQSFYGKTSKTKIFSGWIPATKIRIADSAIKRVSENRCYIEWSDPEEISKRSHKPVVVPVKFSSPAFLSPFRMLVRNYAMPEYGTIDPTPFVSLLYFIMFGLMFGDAGHGLVIFLIGVFGSIFFKKKDPGYYSLSKLLLWCGTSAIGFGILFGSYFGYELFQPVWFSYHAVVIGHGGDGFIKTIYDILFITMVFGIFVIGLGLVMNWINLIKKRDWAKLFVEKRGLLGGYMYVTGIYLSFFMAGNNFRVLPPVDLLIFFVGIPAFIFMLKPPVEFFIHRKKHPEMKISAMTFVNFFMEWFVEMLEVYTGYLSNTLSFMRVAALGIAHVSLVVVFDQLSHSAGVAGIFVLLLGHALIIALEGLSAGIQSLRLNYYEFFSKFFTGTGVPYLPVTLEGENIK
jgi:V/A-type H+-transporting ATPase subunit I